jgi:hypothetical protein
MAELTGGSVQQVLEVLEHAQRSHKRGTPFPTAYHDAVRDVSNRHHVTYQTIGDFRRRLGFRDIDEYLDLIGRWLRGDADAIRRRIKQHSTPGAHALIDQFFRGERTSPATSPATSVGSQGSDLRSGEQAPIVPPTDSEELRLHLSPEMRRRLSLAHLAKVAPTLEETAVVLLERGFEAEKNRIREFLNSTVGAP